MEDLVPELQGRFPIHVDLQPLTEDDFVRILKEPDNAVIKQYQELLKVDGVTLSFNDEAIREIAKASYLANAETENIGARRLHAVMENLLKDILFESDDGTTKNVEITKEYVDAHLASTLQNTNLRKYII